MGNACADCATPVTNYSEICTDCCSHDDDFECGHCIMCGEDCTEMLTCRAEDIYDAMRGH